ncbi:MULTISPECIES: hypothetical protein [Streptomyces violaceusniger group]|uniref:Uncharacterized protein n=2 Tax=Streptomyces rhizosphaericus TaxID=114699 RepID=A0ABN1S686_9ACTN|nr:MULTISPECIES: hypothetical protein [Streptomyces violaceusniger group]
MGSPARRSPTSGASGSGDASGRFTAQQLEAGIGDREGPPEPFYQRPVDLVEPGALIPLQQPECIGRGDAALYRLNTGQGSADFGRGELDQMNTRRNVRDYERLAQRSEAT